MTKFRLGSVEGQSMEDDTSLSFLIQGLELFLQFDPTMHINTALVFLTVAINPGIRKTDIERRLKLSNSAGSRHILMMTRKGDVSRLDRPGHDLISTDTDPLDSRSLRCHLTKKGVALRDRIIATLKRIPTSTR
jgi:DNA-binding MarR family transcriptional regulator